MKKALLFIAGGMLMSVTANAQCPIGGLGSVYCDGDAAVTLTPSGSGILSGPGITGNVFDPTAAGVGTHTISYLETSTATYTVVESGTYAPQPTTGTAVFLGDDQVSGILPIGFTFEFFGVTYTDFYISSNGFISFDAGVSQGCCSGGTIPSGDAVNNSICWSWNDLYPPGSGTITYETVGTAPNQMLLVTFTDQFHCCSGPAVNTSQIILYEGSNVIEIHSAEITNDGSVCTQGIENGAGTLGYTPTGRNAAIWTTTNDYVAFFPDTICNDVQMVDVVALPVVTAMASVDTICAGDSIVFTGGGADSAYVWTGGVMDGVSFAPTASGYFYVTGYDSSGCSAMDSVMIEVNPTPSISLSSTDEIAGTDGTITGVTSGGTAPYTYDWDNDGTGDFDDTESLTGLTAGTYNVVVADSNGCTFSASIVVNSQVGFEDLSGVEITIFPNPSNGIFQISFDKVLDDLYYEIINANGQIVLTQKVTNSTEDVNISGNAAGLYLVKVVTKNGVTVKQIVLK